LKRKTCETKCTSEKYTNFKSKKKMDKSIKFADVIAPRFKPVVGQLPYVEPSSPEALAHVVQKAKRIFKKKAKGKAKDKSANRPSKKAAQKNALKKVKGERKSKAKAKPKTAKPKVAAKKNKTKKSKKATK
tara:strand:+ start:324 stop:716 length:393 start_codon:yes stop_codon:yes gene_type:complete